MDREFNYNVSSSLGLLGSGRGLNRRGAPIGYIWAEFQLKRSHGDPFRDQNHVFVTSFSLVLTNYYLALTIYYLVLTTYYLVLTNDYLVVTIGYLVVTIDFLVVTMDYLLVTTLFL